jgi:membrane fusion protein, multidrug efflux system
MSPWRTRRRLFRRQAAHALFGALLTITASIAAAADIAPVRGVLRPIAQATLSTDISARVAKVGFKDGEVFHQGDVLVAFDCARQEADLASADAQEREMRVSLDSAVLLEKRNAGNRTETETARARADKAHAEANSIRARLAQCVIAAPYDGRVTGIDIHEHEYPVPSRPMLSIVADGQPTIELIVPSTWLVWLKPGELFQFAVDETGRSYAGDVERVGASVDTVSQTIKVFGRFTAPAEGILPGMSGAAYFKHTEG